MDGQALDDLMLRLRRHLLAHADRPAPREEAARRMHMLKLEMRRGEVPDLDARMAEIDALFHAPPPRPLRPPVSAPALDAVEARLGFALPAGMRQVYGAIADGGFGPGRGVQPLEAVVTQYLAERAVKVSRAWMRWPERLLPLQDSNHNPICIDSATGAVSCMCLQDLKRGPDKWTDAIQPIAPSLEAWLAQWLDER
jgi:hypothetical protein